MALKKYSIDFQNLSPDEFALMDKELNDKTHMGLIMGDPKIRQGHFLHFGHTTRNKSPYSV